MGGTRTYSVVLSIAAIAGLVTCGGRTPLGGRATASDAGAAADATVAAAGIACAGFDPAWMRSSPSCDSLVAPECDAWARAVLPSGYPVGGACDLGPQQCRFRGVFREIACDPGPSGDEGCRTFAAQFVLAGGVPDARCEANNEGLGPVHYACNFRCEVDGTPCSPLTFAEPLRLCVWRDGGRRCERPCQ